MKNANHKTGTVKGGAKPTVTPAQIERALSVAELVRNDEMLCKAVNDIAFDDFTTWTNLERLLGVLNKLGVFNALAVSQDGTVTTSTIKGITHKEAEELFFLRNFLREVQQS